jgi:hypothetical protein
LDTGRPGFSQENPMSDNTQATLDGVATDANRPDDCDCAPVLADGGLPCWPCYRAGFRSPNPAEVADE